VHNDLSPSDLVSVAAAGEDIVIAGFGKAAAGLVPLESPEPRQAGLAKGLLTDEFFEPLPEEELKLWE